jgi:hypothetical protein
VGTCSTITPFIQEIKKSTEKSISEIEDKFCGNELISLAFYLMASLFAFFHSGRGSNTQKCGTKENTERIDKWSDPWWMSFLTLHDSRAFFKGGDVKARSMVVPRRFWDHVLVPGGNSRLRKCALKKELKYTERVSVVALSPPHKGW